MKTSKVRNVILVGLVLLLAFILVVGSKKSIALADDELSKENQFDLIVTLKDYLQADMYEEGRYYISNRYDVVSEKLTEKSMYFVSNSEKNICGVLSVSENRFGDKVSCFWKQNITIKDDFYISQNKNSLFIVTKDKVINWGGEDEYVAYDSAFYPLVWEKEMEFSYAANVVNYDIPLPHINNSTYNGAGLCWAACCASRINYEKGTSLTANGVVGMCMASSYPGKPSGTPSGTSAWVQYAFAMNNINTTSVATGLPGYEIVNCISHSKPIYCSLERVDLDGNSYGHAIMIKGICVSGNTYTYKVMDPNMPANWECPVTSSMYNNPSYFTYDNGFQQYTNWYRSIY